MSKDEVHAYVTNATVVRLNRSTPSIKNPLMIKNVENNSIEHRTVSENIIINCL